MEHKKLIIAINSAPDSVHFRELIERHCIKPGIQDIAYYFFIGRPESKEEKVGNVVYLNCDGSYEGLSQKILANLKYLEANYDYDYLFKIDDNSYFDAARLLDLSRRLKAEYAGSQHNGPFLTNYHLRKVKNKNFEKNYSEPWRGPYAHGGPGYFMSRKAVRALLRASDGLDPRKEFYEDKFIGDSMRLLGFDLTNLGNDLCFYSKDTVTANVATIKCRTLNRLRLVIWIKKIPISVRAPLIIIAVHLKTLLRKSRLQT
ncbi:MAG: hypothetical protein EBR01_08740 [Proteobacteria bacterium]|nr:hypothetical protein [Pseudomonadota bacterium]